MFPIYLNTEGKGYDFTSFNKKMIKVCNEHRQKGRALAFAFILYDFENPQLWEILNDPKYWLALNQISGEYLTVFSVNYSPAKKTNNLQYLTKVTASYDPRLATNTLIQKYFKDTTVKYPAILFFQVDNNSVIDALLIDLKEEEVEKSFLELRDFLKSAVQALKRITPQNKQNTKEIFDCLQNEVKSANISRKTVRVLKNLGPTSVLISSIKG